MCPSPTSSVISAISMPRARTRFRISGVKCSPAVGAATALPCLRVNRLVAFAIERLIGALDIRRQRNVAEPVERFVKAVLGGKIAETRRPILAARFDHERFEFAFTFAEDDALADRNFSSGPHERLPGVRCELAHQQNFDRRLQEFISRGAVRARRCGVNARAPAE